MSKTPGPKNVRITPGLEIDAIVAHLVHSMADYGCTRDGVFQRLKGRLRWKEEAAMVAIDRCIARGLVLVRKEKGGERLVSGAAFDANAFPKEREAANKALSRAARVPHADRTRDRREAILAELSPRMARTTESLWNALHETFGYRRKLERDLADLRSAGLIRRDQDGWRDARDGSVLSENATYTALRLLDDLVADLIPDELQKSIKEQLGKAKKRLESLQPNDPAARWMRAFRIVPHHHGLGDPIIDPDIRDVIEDAILTHRKVRLRWPDVRWEEREGQPLSERIEYVAEHDCSISHFLIEVPANPSIEVWYGAGAGPRRLPLKDVLGAELLKEPADYPADHEPDLIPRLLGFSTQEGDSHGGKSLLTLAMKHDTYKELLRSRIGKLLTVLEEDRAGQMIVGMRYHLDGAVLRYFEQLPGVTVLSPQHFRRFAAQPAGRKHDEYEKTEPFAGRLYGFEPDEVGKAFQREMAERFERLSALRTDE